MEGLQLRLASCFSLPAVQLVSGISNPSWLSLPFFVCSCVGLVDWSLTSNFLGLFRYFILSYLQRFFYSELLDNCKDSKLSFLPSISHQSLCVLIPELKVAEAALVICWFRHLPTICLSASGWVSKNVSSDG